MNRENLQTGRQEAIRGFDIDGTFLECTPCGNGHINDTFMMSFDRDGETHRYSLQHMNRSVFKDPVSLMNNILHVTAYLKEQIANSDNKDKDLDQIINDAANKFEITLNEDQFNQLKSLLEKLGGLHLDLGSLKSQAQAAYDTLKDMGFDISKIHIDTEEARGLLQQIIETIKGWFN